jgi:hypothetical protein
MKKILSILLLFISLQSFLFPQVEANKKAIAGFDLTPKLNPNILAEKLDYTIARGDTIEIWLEFPNRRFYKVFVGGEWGWIGKGQVTVLDEDYSKIDDKDINTKSPKSNNSNIENNNEITEVYIDKNNSDRTYIDQDVDKIYDQLDLDSELKDSKVDDKPGFLISFFGFLFLIGFVDYVINLSIVTSFLIIMLWILFIFAYPIPSLSILLLGVIIYFIAQNNESKKMERNYTPPVPSYEINSYTKDEICEFLIDKSFIWDGRRCTMEYTYGSGTVWVIGSGIFGDKLIRANKLYKSELVEIYMDVYGEQEPPVGYNYREPIPQRTKDKVWNRDEGECTKCGSNIDLEYDHIKPVSAGGKSTYRNLQLLCQSCNRSKGAKIE